MRIKMKTNAKKIAALCLLLAAALCASAKPAAKNGEITMKEKNICIPAEGKENGDLRNYHYFQLCVSADNMLQLNCDDGPMEYIEKYLDFEAHFHFPMEKVPEVVKTMTDAFYLCDSYVRLSYTITLPDSEFTAGLDFNEMHKDMDGYTLLQDGDKIWECIDLEWDVETNQKFLWNACA